MRLRYHSHYPASHTLFFGVQLRICADVLLLIASAVSHTKMSMDVSRQGMISLPLGSSACCVYRWSPLARCFPPASWSPWTSSRGCMPGGGGPRPMYRPLTRSHRRAMVPLGACSGWWTRAPCRRTSSWRWSGAATCRPQGRGRSTKVPRRRCWNRWACSSRPARAHGSTGHISKKR